MRLSEMLVEFDKFAQVNSNDVITLKMLHRHFKDVVYKELGGNKNVPYLKDKLLVWAKDVSKNNPRLNYKKAVEYINQVYDKQTKISYSDFVKGLQGLNIEGGSAWIMDPDEQAYQTTQRLVPSSERNKTTTVLKDYSVLDDILKKYSNEFPDDVAQIEDLAKHGHFNNAIGFIRFTVVDKNWVHIDAFQTDFFNKMRKYAAMQAKAGSKDAKKLYSEILGVEDEVFKTALSHTKFKNPSAKIWTMNTGAMVKEVEHIRSEEKAADIYDTFPAKLGFKRIPMEQFKKILETRHINIQKQSLANKLFTSEKVDNAFNATMKDLSDPVTQKRIAKEIIKIGGEKTIFLASIQTKIYDALVRILFDYTPEEFTDRFRSSEKLLSVIHSDLPHQLALFIWNADLGDDGEFIQENLTPQRLTFKINSLVQGFKDNTEGKEDNMKYPDIWWANRDMLNEDTLAFNEALFERLGW